MVQKIMKDQLLILTLICDMVKLENLINGIEVISSGGDLNREIVSVVFDSRKVEKNCLFVAVTGTKVDGHDFYTGSY